MSGRCSSIVLGLAVGFVLTSALLGDDVVGSEPTADLSGSESSVSAEERQHWSYQPVERPDIPEVKNEAWARTPIDHFVLARLEAQGWQPNPAAKPHELLRRLYLDLIGLPPTLAEQDRFLADATAAQLDQEGERLLRRAGYGERWARHWLDLVRYAESNGYERDAAKPHVWRYRDYVIRSLNEDKAYDRFVLEQIAGDELPDANTDTVIATGFCRLGPWDDEPADPAQDRHDQLDDLVRTTSQVFLGLTLGCARCHDHKFDALSLHDYYRMSAIFAPLRRPQLGRKDLDAPAGSPEQLAILAERDRRVAELRGEQESIRAGSRDEYLAAGRSQLDKGIIEAFAVDEEQRSDEQAKLVAENLSKLTAEIDAYLPATLRTRVEQAERSVAQIQTQLPDLPKAYFLHEEGGELAPSYLLLRGRAATPGPEVQPGLPAVLVGPQPDFKQLERTSGRRLTLARWLASADHPLTARVIVNRVWQHHFGQALVRTPSDFGVMGDPPTHPALLDWLAHWFVHEADWSLKELHRLVVRSNVYRMSSHWHDEYGPADPENRLFWRFPYRRLQVEAIRDSMLAASGALNRKMYGPGVQLHIPQVVVDGHADRDKIWQPSSLEERSRRTVYAFVKRSLVVPMLEVLDLCDTTRSTAKRNITSVAPQALTLFNGEFVNGQAAVLADRILAEIGEDANAQLTRAWRHALCRVPSPAERATMLQFLRDEADRFASETGEGEEMSRQESQRQALIQLCRAIFNLNEFVYCN